MTPRATHSLITFSFGHARSCIYEYQVLHVQIQAGDLDDHQNKNYKKSRRLPTLTALQNIGGINHKGYSKHKIFKPDMRQSHNCSHASQHEYLVYHLSLLSVNEISARN